MPVTRPPALNPGGTIGIVSPSWFGGRPYVRRVERGIAELHRLGYRTRVAAHALENAGWVSAPAEARAADLHDMFADPDVTAIFATIGGDHACQVLTLLDWDLVRANPKILLGFSDITVLNVALHVETGLVTFNGPSLMTDWAEFPAMPSYARDAALAALTQAEPIGRLSPSPEWTEEFLDWETGADETRPRQMRSSRGWTWIRRGRAEGTLIGGCLASLQHLRGTRWWPSWEGALLFIETSEERPTPATVDGILSDYENMGMFDRIRGMIVARTYGYSEVDRRLFHDVVRTRTARWGFPVLADVDAGHTSPILTLPIGVRAELDSAIDAFAILEPAVSGR